MILTVMSQLCVISKIPLKMESSREMKTLPTRWSHCCCHVVNKPDRYLRPLKLAILLEFKLKLVTKLVMTAYMYMDVSLHCLLKARSIPGPLQRRYYRGDKKFHFMNMMVVVDTDGYIVYVKSGFMGHLTDATCYAYSHVPALPAGCLMMGDAGFPARPQLIVPVRRGQMQHRQGLNRLVK